MKFLWADTLRDFAREYGFTPRDVLDGMTFGQFYAVWCTKPQVVEGLDLAAINAKIKKRRRELGMDKPKPKAG